MTTAGTVQGPAPAYLPPDFVIEPTSLQDHLLGTYFNLRVGIAVLAIALPLFLAIVGVLTGISLQASMSAYYWARAAKPDCALPPAPWPPGTLRNEFVGTLIAVSAFLYLYKGFSRSENIALNLAGIFGVTVALVPTHWPPCEAAARINVHSTAAVLFFLCIAYVAVFRAADTLSLIDDPKRRAMYQRWYKLLGMAMIVSPLVAVVFNDFITTPGTTSSKVFFIEAFGVWAFAAYWIVKSRELRESSVVQRVIEGSLKRAKRHRPGRPDDAQLITALLFVVVTARLASGQAAIVQQAADPLNLGFERAGLVSPTSPANWYTGGQGYIAVLDSVSPQSGVRSLRLQATPNRRQGAFGVATSSLHGSAIAGKTIKFRGYIRTEAVKEGYAGLWMRIDSGTKVVGFDNMSMRGVTGTTGWTAYEITLQAPLSVTGANFGALLPGDGTAWFDSFSIEIDGVPLGTTTSTWHATAAEAKWVKDHAIPLTTSDPNAPLDDLRPLDDIVGDARIVELGEGTHGTSEFFQMKHRLTEYLAQRKGFTVFAIEANMPEARRVNEYVLTGRGDPKAALAGMYFWTWNTQEVLDFIEWMRRYNASGKGRMEFWGFDLQTPNVAMDSVRAFVRRADTTYAASVDSAYAHVTAVVNERRSNTLSPTAAAYWESEANRVLEHLRNQRVVYVAAGHDSLEVAWAIQNARIVVQAAGSARTPTSRDSSMAANVQWIEAHQPAGTKMVLWAHNGHVAREPNWMGAHLAAHYGEAMRVIGFSLGDGDYTAVGPRGLAPYPAATPEAGTLEEVFRATGIPRFALDVRGAGKSPDAAFLAASHSFRSIGAMATDNQFFPTNVASRFDVVIYFDHTKASARLPAQPRPPN